MSNINSAHDKFFKSIMAKPNVAKEFLERHLPKNILKNFDTGSLKLQKDSFIDTQFKSQMTDLLFSTTINSTKGYVYILFEHLSNPDKLIAFRLIKYIIQIMDQHLKQNNTKILPIVYPILFYTGQQKYYYSTNFFDLFAHHKKLAKNIFLQPLNFVDINKLDPTDIKELQFALMLKTFKHCFDDSNNLFKIIIEDLKMADKNGDFDIINIVVKYISIVRNYTDTSIFFDKLASNLSENSGEKIMTYAEHFENIGMQKGKENTYKEIISSLHHNGFQPKKISELIGLPEEKIKSYLAEKLN